MNTQFNKKEMPGGHAASPERSQVIAIHGSASTGGQWRRLVGTLSASYDVVRPDLPGYGRNQNVVPQGEPSLASDAIEIERIAKSTAAPSHIVAHSYGAAVALKFALGHPHRVASLTLIEPALFHLLRSGEADDLAHYTEISGVANAVRMAAQFDVPEQGMASFVDYWNGVGTWARMKPGLQAALSEQVAQVARNFAAAFQETWAASALGQLSCPTLIIAAADSRLPAIRVAEIVAMSVPLARMKVVANAGHMAPVTHPEIINPLIADALAAATFGRAEASPREAA